MLQHFLRWLRVVLSKSPSRVGPPYERNAQHDVNTSRAADANPTGTLPPVEARLHGNRVATEADARDFTPPPTRAPDPQPLSAHEIYVRYQAKKSSTNASTGATREWVSPVDDRRTIDELDDALKVGALNVRLAAALELLSRNLPESRLLLEKYTTEAIGRLKIIASWPQNTPEILPRIGKDHRRFLIDLEFDIFLYRLEFESRLRKLPRPMSDTREIVKTFYAPTLLWGCVRFLRDIIISHTTLNSDDAEDKLLARSFLLDWLPWWFLGKSQVSASILQSHYIRKVGTVAGFPEVLWTPTKEFLAQDIIRDSWASSGGNFSGATQASRSGTNVSAFAEIMMVDGTWSSILLFWGTAKEDREETLWNGGPGSVATITVSFEDIRKAAGACLDDRRHFWLFPGLHIYSSTV